MAPSRERVDWPSFAATPWCSSRRKQQFADRFVKFVEADFAERLFSRGFYNAVSQIFGHHAHYNAAQFYADFFTTAHGKSRFIDHIAHGAFAGLGDPSYTWSDVEQAIQEVASERRWAERFQQAAIAEQQILERALLRELASRYPDEVALG